MNTNEISGKRQLEPFFWQIFDYIREAGTAGEEKAAERIQKTLDSFGVPESHLEEFSFDTFSDKKAKLDRVTEPYVKEYKQ